MLEAIIAPLVPKNTKMKRPDFEILAREIVDASFQVHNILGPGLLESAYQRCLAYELVSRGIPVEIEKPLPLVYKEIHLEAGYRIDILVDNKIVLEIKSVDQLLPIHTAQLLTYLKLAEKPLGFLINFNVSLIKDGIKRLVNNY